MASFKAGIRWASVATLQWAPTLTAHDPNPPITLESPAGGTTHDVSAAIAGAGAVTVSAGRYAGAAETVASASTVTVSANHLLGSSMSVVGSSSVSAASGLIAAASEALASVSSITVVAEKIGPPQDPFDLVSQPPRAGVGGGRGWGGFWG